MNNYKIIFNKTFFKKDGRKMLVDNEKSYTKKIASFNNIEKAKEFLKNYELKENETISFLEEVDTNNYKRYYKATDNDGMIILKSI